MGRNKVNKYSIPTGTQDEKIIAMLKLLDMEAAALSLNNIYEMNRAAHGTALDFLYRLLDVEYQQKEENRVNRWIQQARFPFKRGLKEFDFDFQPSINRVEINDLSTCRFIAQGKNVIFLGPPGVGKTHLSVALGLEAINHGFETRFLRLDELIEQIENTDLETSIRLHRNLMRIKLLILDDIDFYDTGQNGSTFLFKLMSERAVYGLSTILSSNKEFTEWGALFDDDARAVAAVDRITGGAHIINITGNSYRTKDNVRQLETVAA